MLFGMGHAVLVVMLVYGGADPQARLSRNGLAFRRGLLFVSSGGCFVRALFSRYLPAAEPSSMRRG